jgi:hypothetical protein
LEQVAVNLSKPESASRVLCAPASS